MAEHWDFYRNRLLNLEDNVNYQNQAFDQMRNRNESHAAKLKFLEDEFMALKSQNVLLKDEVNELRCKTLDDRFQSYNPSPVPQVDQQYPLDISPRYDRKETEKRNMEFQKEIHSHREAYRDQMYGPDMENKYNTRQWKPLNEQKVGDAHLKKETQRIELHPGNFKPWAGVGYPRNDFHSTAAHGGVYLFIRTKAGAFHQIGDALKRNRNILSISGGKLKGIAMPHQIKILEGRHGWNIRAPLARTGEYWSERTDRSGQVEDMILVFQFGSISDAQSWLRSEPHFKNADFPAPDMADIFISGEKYPDDNEYNTFLTLEIHRCIWREFSDKLAPKLQGIVRRRGAVWEDNLMGMPHKAVHIRGTWVNPHSIFTVIRFRNRGEAIDFCLDSEFEEVQKQMRQLISRHLSNNPDVFETTIVLFTLRNMY